MDDGAIVLSKCNAVANIRIGAVPYGSHLGYPRLWGGELL